MITVGIDSGKNRVDAVALLSGHIVRHYTIDLEKQKNKGRGWVLTTMDEGVFDFLLDLEAQYKMPIEVWVEEAIMVRSIRVAIELAETVGMILSLPYSVHKVTIDQWKMVAIGKGGVSKDEVRRVIALRHPETEELFGKRQDLFDAAGVSIYGEVVGSRPTS